MKSLFLGLCFSLSLFGKVHFYSLGSEEPNWIEFQEKMFAKFILDEYQCIRLNSCELDEAVSYVFSHFDFASDDIVVVMKGDFCPIRPTRFRDFFYEKGSISDPEASCWIGYDLSKTFLKGKQTGSDTHIYAVKHSSDFHLFPSEQLLHFGFNGWEAKLIKALPHMHHLDFHLDNHFLNLCGSEGIQEKLRFLNACLKNKRVTDYEKSVDLQKIYAYYASLLPKDCDIGEHLPLLAQLASECSTVTEIGLGKVLVSTWGILFGLDESKSLAKSYLGVDILCPKESFLTIAEQEAAKRGIACRFVTADDLTIDLEPVDFLFIDSMHTYCHLMYELETFSSKVKKYIALHDTSEPWEFSDDSAYEGDYSEYPAKYSREKKGLWPAVVDFLAAHPEWVLIERRLNCHGFTILKRVYD